MRRDVESTDNVSERACGFPRTGATSSTPICSIVATGRLNGRSPQAAIRAALTIRPEPENS
jgi:hypothetical protein